MPHRLAARTETAFRPELFYAQNGSLPRVSSMRWFCGNARVAACENYYTILLDRGWTHAALSLEHEVASFETYKSVVCRKELSGLLPTHCRTVDAPL